MCTSGRRVVGQVLKIGNGVVHGIELGNGRTGALVDHGAVIQHRNLVLPAALTAAADDNDGTDGTFS